MGHFLKIAALGMYPKLEISESHANSLSVAQQLLSKILRLEEKLDILLRNYKDLERTFYDILLLDATELNYSYETFHSQRLAIDTRVLNLLTTSKLYIDSTLSSDIFDDKGLVKSLFNAVYDKHFEYRFCEALRNYAQHSETPVHSQHMDSSWREEPERHLEFSAIFYSNRDYLKKDKTFKSSVLSEMPDRVDLKRAIRIYIGCLGETHQELRALIKSKADDARQLVMNAIDQYAKLTDVSLIGLACFVDTTSEPLFHVNLKWDDIRVNLQQKNGSLQNMHLRILKP